MQGFSGKPKQNIRCLQCKTILTGKSHQKFCAKSCRTKFHYLSNKEQAIAYSVQYKQNRLASDINYKLAEMLRHRIYSAIKNNQKVGSAVKDLGCTVAELKLYLESKFLPGMSWDNWAINGWHIDHIKPLSSFNLCDVEDFKKACHFTNLQPLWAKDNLIKGSSV